uniref:Uncharacterized protein n=2 Tax=Anguilla anguilla TaxID=7936 RepID=A0A0E9U498_ANGAN
MEKTNLHGDKPSMDQISTAELINTILVFLQTVQRKQQATKSHHT